MKFIRSAGLALVGALTLSGCFEQPEVELHQPGEYKGPSDPLLQAAATPEYQQRLAERMQQIQTDR